MQYARSQPTAASNGAFDCESKRQEEANALLINNQGDENPFKLWRELGDMMTRNCTVIRYNKDLKETDVKLVELLQRFRHVNLSDKSQWANTTFAFARQLYNMLQLARVIVQGAALRNESRGAHYKPDFPERDDKNFLEDDQGLVRARCGRTPVRVRAGGYIADPAASRGVLTHDAKLDMNGKRSLVLSSQILSWHSERDRAGVPPVLSIRSHYWRGSFLAVTGFLLPQKHGIITWRTKRSFLKSSARPTRSTRLPGKSSSCPASRR